MNTYKIASIAIIFAATVNIASATDIPHVGISAKTVAKTLKKLGVGADEYKDKKGNPHFVLTDSFGAKQTAIFMEDCKKGTCEDVTFYSNFGPAEKLTADKINDWNHIGSKLRSKAFYSKGTDGKVGDIGIAATASYTADKEVHEFGMQLGLYLVEVKLFAATLKQLD